MRSRLRIKERKLKKLAGYGYIQATGAADIERLLDAFFALKAVHMRAQGLINVFAEPGVPEFLRQASHIKLPDGRPLIELHALEGDGEVLALYGAVVDGYRFSAMFNTYTLSCEYASAQSRPYPAAALIAACAQRGARCFDIGVGRAHYKSFFWVRSRNRCLTPSSRLRHARRLGRARLPRRLCRQADDQGQNLALWGTRSISMRAPSRAPGLYKARGPP